MNANIEKVLKLANEVQAALHKQASQVVDTAPLKLPESREEVVEYVNNALLKTIHIGVVRLKDPSVPFASIANFGEFLRKVRADLVGTNVSTAPTMFVNISLDPSQTIKPVAPVTIIDGGN